MAKNDERRGARTFHSVVAILLLLAGGALLGFGIWLQATKNGRTFDLDFSDSTPLRVALNARVGAMILGAFVLVTGIVSLIALGKNCLGKTFRIIYVLMALLILVVLVFVTAASILVLRNRQNDDVRNVFEEAWKRTIESEDSIVCEIEDTFECRGLANNDCNLCVTGLESTCAGLEQLCAKCPGNPARDASVGCYDRIIGRLRNLFLPVAIGGGVLSAVVLTDIFITCML